jgi:predicted DCC family thiol-disulfide oxidoreductase YuxK
MNDHPVLLFDGVCNLCNGAVQFIIKRDKKAVFRFASLQSEAGQRYLKKFNLPLSDFNSFVIIENEKAYTRSTGALRAASKLGGAWKAMNAFYILPGPVRDFFYNLIAKNRYRLFGQRNECMIPTPELKSRFL